MSHGSKKDNEVASRGEVRGVHVSQEADDDIVLACGLLAPSFIQSPQRLHRSVFPSESPQTALEYQKCGAPKLFVDTAQIPGDHPSGVRTGWLSVRRYTARLSGEMCADSSKEASRCVGVKKAGQRVVVVGKLASRQEDGQDFFSEERSRSKLRERFLEVWNVDTAQAARHMCEERRVEVCVSEVCRTRRGIQLKNVGGVKVNIFS